MRCVAGNFLKITESGNETRSRISAGSDTCCADKWFDAKTSGGRFWYWIFTLSKWIQQDQKNPEKPAAQSDMEHENAKLRKEIRLLREEREVLKLSR